MPTIIRWIGIVGQHFNYFLGKQCLITCTIFALTIKEKVIDLIEMFAR
jgi:hypothetical protein